MWRGLELFFTSFRIFRIQDFLGMLKRKLDDTVRLTSVWPAPCPTLCPLVLVVVFDWQFTFMLSREWAWFQRLQLLQAERLAWFYMIVKPIFMYLATFFNHSNLLIPFSKDWQTQKRSFPDTDIQSFQELIFYVCLAVIQQCIRVSLQFLCRKMCPQNMVLHPTFHRSDWFGGHNLLLLLVLRLYNCV